MSAPINVTNNDTDSWVSRFRSGLSKDKGSYAKAGKKAISEGSEAYQNARSIKESKRKALADLLNSSMNRNQDLFDADRESQNEMADFQSQAMQQIARGFVNSL